MFAGGRVITHELLVLGEAATRTTWLADTRQKQGRTGPLTFVTVRNEYTQGGRLCIVDENDIVYLTPGSTSTVPAGTPEIEPRSVPGEPALSLAVDEAMLFRFSALTYNAHRIHYDHNWVRQEGYGDLVVHGPLQALMMGELIRRTGDGLAGKAFAYRLVSAMIGPQTFTVVAGEGGLSTGAEVRDALGKITAVSTLRPIDPLPQLS